MRTNARTALAALAAPVTMVLLAACGGSPGGNTAAGITTVGAGSTVAQSAQPSDAATSAGARSSSGAKSSSGHKTGSAVGQTSQGPASGATGAVSSGSAGDAAGASGICTQTQSAPGEPRFTGLTLSAPSQCPTGSAVTPTLVWETADATAVKVAIQHSGGSISSQTLGTHGKVTLNPITCDAAPGTVITQRYDLWAMGAVASDHRMVKLSTKVLVIIKLPTFTLSPTAGPVPVPPQFPMPKP